MNYRRRFYQILTIFLCLLFLITACGGMKDKSKSGAAAKESDPPLSKKFGNVVISKFTATSEIQKDYPDAMGECQDNLLKALKEKGSFENVTKIEPGMKYPEGTLLVKANISDMRIVRGVARFFGGVFVGSSFMNVDVKLVDEAQNKLLREKKITSKNNPWAAVWVGGSSDSSLPADMGKIIAGYIDSINSK